MEIHESHVMRIVHPEMIYVCINCHQCECHQDSWPLDEPCMGKTVPVTIETPDGSWPVIGTAKIRETNEGIIADMILGDSRMVGTVFPRGIPLTETLLQFEKMELPKFTLKNPEKMELPKFTLKNPEEVKRMTHAENEKISTVPGQLDGNQFMEKAKKIVHDYVVDKLDVTDPQPDFVVFVVWFTKTLNNWKAMVSTTLPDGMYYEVTYDGQNSRTYLDAYKKFENVVIPD